MILRRQARVNEVGDLGSGPVVVLSFDEETHLTVPVSTEEARVYAKRLYEVVWVTVEIGAKESP